MSLECCLGQLCSIVPCLWDCSAKHSAYITDLEDNLNSLRTAVEELNNLSQDVKNRVKEDEEQHMKTTNQVIGWLQRAEAMNDKVNPILEKSSQEIENKCVASCCPKNCWSSYKLGKKVFKMLPQVTGLIEKGQFDVIAYKLPPPPMDELPMESTVVGFESKLQELWDSVHYKDFSIIGLVGIGGVGKTTLLKQLNNKFLTARHDFDLVIWILISKPTNLARIRDTIRNKLNIPDHLWENKSECQRVSIIHNKLKEKKFVMLLDDLWDKLELSEVGIPIPSHGLSKVVLTTRFEEVCNSMEADKVIKVGCLPSKLALKLFCSKVGENMLQSHPELQKLVKDVASECDGLPLALTTIGRSMRGKTDVRQWKDAKKILEKYPSTFPGMEGVFCRLVFSYDNLPSSTHQKCFEYCSVYPEDYEIEKEELIKLWIAERLIDEHDAIIRGRQILENLVQACLLEVNRYAILHTVLGKEIFKMHDVIRDMALWLACERGAKKNKFCVDVISGDDGLSSLDLRKWRNAEKIFLEGYECFTTVESLVGSSFYANLVTLIIRNIPIKFLPVEILQCHRTLKVLDLSHNRELSELPAEIGSLINLEYLNIRSTGLRWLPAEIQQLKKLRFLLLSDRTAIPRGVISSLHSLQSFEQNQYVDAGYVYLLLLTESEEEKRNIAKEREMVEELRELKDITHLCLVLRWPSSLQILLDSQKLRSCTVQLALCQCESLPVVLDLSGRRLMERLETLEMRCCNMSVLRFGPASLGNLRHISITMCYNIRNVSSLVYVPHLYRLSVTWCGAMEELIGEDYVVQESVHLFSSLASLTLNSLHKLKSICPQSVLPFPSLKVLDITDCPNLKKLPLDSNTAKTTPPEFRIQGHRGWWDSTLEWDSQESKDAFTPKFKPHQLYGRV